MKIRRIALRGLVAVPLVAAGGAALVSYLPRLVRDRVVQRARVRTGLEARLGDVSLGLSSIRLRDLSLGAGDGPLIEIDELELEASPLLAAFRGAAAIRSVVVRELRVTLPMHAASTRELLTRLAQRGARGAADDDVAKDSEPRGYRVEGLSVQLRDELGALAAVEGSSVIRDAEGLHAVIEHVSVGAAPDMHLEVKHVVLDATVDGGVRLRKLDVDGVEVLLAAPPEPVPVALDPAGEDGEDGPVAGAPPTPTRPTTPMRILAVANALADARREATVNDGGGAPSGQRAGAATTGLPVLDRLAPDAELSVVHGRVSSSDGTPVLEELGGRLEVAGERQLAFSGEGTAIGGGAVSWAMKLWPVELRADGDIELRAVPLSLIAPFLPSVPWHDADEGRVDAKLVVKTETARRIAVSGEATIRDAAISAARVAASPVTNINMTVVGRGHWLPADKRLEIGAARVTVGEASVDLRGALEWTREHYLLDLDATLPSTPCTEALHSIPMDLLGDLALATWDGRISGTFRAKVDSRALNDTVLELDLDDRCAFATVPAMADLRRFRMPFMHSVLEPDGSVFEMETGPGTPAWTYLEDVSPFFVHAVLAHEDAGFFKHPGFSLLHIRNAVVRNLQEGRYVVGASTITMQLVKNVFLHREKTLARKIQEVLLTWWLERVMEKREILELYLNVIEYGPGVYGIRSGAKHYFNRLPSQLSPAEAVYLSTILPNPKRYHSHFEKGELSSGWHDRMKKIFTRMRARGWYSEEAVEYGLRELERFRFVPEGVVTEARDIPGTTAPLPYLRAYQQNWDWDAPEELLEDGASTPGSFDAMDSPSAAP